MLSINQIRQELLVAQDELSEELASVERALQALGKPKEVPAKTTLVVTKRRKKTEIPSQNVINLALKAVQNSEQPLKTAEVARMIKKSPSQAVKALAHLRREGKITSSLAKGQKGRAFLWSPVKPEMEQDLAPKREPEREPAPEMAGWAK